MATYETCAPCALSAKSARLLRKRIEEKGREGRRFYLVKERVTCLISVTFVLILEAQCHPSVSLPIVILILVAGGAVAVTVHAVVAAVVALAVTATATVTMTAAL